MENIRIYAPGDILLLDVPVTAKSTHEQELMKTDHIHLEWSDSECVNLPLGAYVRVDNIVYTLAKPYYPDSRNMGKYDYSVDFEHELMLLQRVPFLLYREDGVECDWNYTGLFQDLKNALKQAIFKAVGVYYDIRIDESVNRAISLSFSNIDILSALNSIADALECEWWYEDAISGTRGEAVIHFGPKCVHEHGEDSVLELTAGQEVGYPSSNNKGEFFSRFFVFGSTRNIPQDYEGANANTIVNKRLTLDPSIHPEGYMDLPAFDINGNILETTGTDPNGRPFWKEDGSLGYYRVDQSVTDGVRTFTKVLQLDDIYPRADLHVAHVAKCVKFVRDQNGEKVELTPGVFSTFSVFYVQFADVTGKVFDINPTTYQTKSNPDGHVLPNTTPGIHFNSGALTGREFEVFKYHEVAPAVKNETDGESVSFAEFSRGDINAGIFEIQYKENNTIIIPNDGIEPIANDKAVVFNIRMPEAYVTKGYKDLDQAALVQIYEATKDGNEYTVQGNSVYFAENEPGITLGRHVYFYTQDRKIDTRVVKLTRNLDRRFEIELSLGKSVTRGAIQTILTNIESTQQSVVTTQLESRQAVKEAQKRAYDAQRELHDMIFDTDGYFKDGNIRPETIETLMLTVGAVSTNLELTGVTFCANNDGTTAENPNAVNIIQGTSAKLIHYGMSDSEVKEWTLTKPATAYTKDEDGRAFVSSTAYYLYARCSTSGSSGSFVFSTNKYKYNQFVDTSRVYYFLIGVLSSVLDGYRVLNMTYGNTAITGDQMRTGSIRSNNGDVVIDLNAGKIYAKNGFTFMPVGATKAKEFTDYATETDNAILLAESNAVSAAQTNTDNAISNLQIGGRNLFLKSRGDEIGYATRYNATISIEDNTLKVEKTVSGRGGFYINVKGMSASRPTQNCNWVVSVEVKGSVASKMNMGTNNYWSNVDITTEWTRVYVTKPMRPIATMTFYPIEIGTFWFRNWKLEEGNKATAWSEAPEDAENRVVASLDSVNTTLSGQIVDLQKQVDKRVDYWYLNGAPTLNNAPAKDWTTTALKQEHEGDEYLDLTTNKVYRFVFLNNAWQWKEMSSSEASEALQLAKDAKAIADGKRRVFVSTPYVPYDEGDLWIEEGRELMVCAASKTATQSYRESDWVDKLQYAQRIANAEQNAKDYADSSIDAIEIGTRNLFLKSDGSDASTLRTYLASVSVEEGAIKVVRTEGQSAGGVFIRTDRMSALIPTEACNWVLSVDMKSESNQRVYVGIQNVRFSNINTTTEWKRYTLKGSTALATFVFYANAGEGSFYMRNWQLEIGTKASNWSSAPEDTSEEIASAFEEARQAKTDASNARQRAEIANQAIADINDDDIFSISEKYIVRKEYTAISGLSNTTEQMSKGDGSYAKVKDKATTLGISYTECSNKGTALRTMMNALALYSNSDTSFSAKGYSRESLTTVFREYYNAEQALWDSINVKLSDNAQQLAEDNSKSYADAKVQAVRNELASFNAALTNSISDLQTQVDGKIETWFYAYTPTTSNAPASTWNSAEKAKHKDDLFFDTSNGSNRCYRWTGSAWSDITRTDPDVATAMQNASKAQDTADGKRRVFITQPTPPYDKGDLWSGGASGDLKVCQTARKSGSFVASDWALATKYTDDTTANEAKRLANEAQNTADTAKANAKATDDALKAVDNDGVFSTIEKRVMRPQWQAISGVANTTADPTTNGTYKTALDSANSAGLSSDASYTALTTAFNYLKSYLNSVGLYTDANFTFNSSYTRNTLSTRFRNYHKAEVALTEATASKLASTAEANSKTYTNAEVKKANDLAQEAKNSAQNTQNALDAVNSDSIFSTIEKRTIQPQWQSISGIANTTGNPTASGSYMLTKSNADSAGIASTNATYKALTTAFENLKSFLNTVGLYSGKNYTFTTTNTRGKLATVFMDYHKAEVALSDYIASVLASNAESNAKKEIADYGYIKDAINEAQNVAGYQKAGLMLGALLGVGRYKGDIAQEIDPEQWEVRAGMIGGLDDADDALAFFAGGTPESPDLPFQVLHNGTVRMTKGEIVNGSSNGSQVTFGTKANGEVGVISVGSQGGADTEIVGEASGGIDGMLTKAGVSSSSSTPISAGSASVATGNNETASITFTGYSGQPYQIKSASGSNYKDVRLMAAQSSSGTLILGDFSAKKVSATVPAVNYSGIASSVNTTLIAEATIRVLVYVGGITKASAIQTYNLVSGAISGNLSALNGKKVTFSAGESVYIRVYTDIRFSFSVNGTPPTSGGQATVIGGSAEYTTSWTAGTYSLQTLNNILYNDGMFMSRATDKYLAISPVGSDMLRAVNGQSAGLELTESNLKFISKNNYRHAIGKIVFDGYCSYSNSAYTTTNTLQNGVTLEFRQLKTGRYELTLNVSALSTYNDKKYVVLVTADANYTTDLRYMVSGGTATTNGYKYILGVVRGTSDTDFWAKYSYSGSHTETEQMNKINIQIIAY